MLDLPSNTIVTIDGKDYEVISYWWEDDTFYIETKKKIFSLPNAYITSLNYQGLDNEMVESVTFGSKNLDKQ